MNKCPHCNRPAMSLWRKSALGPGRVVNCQACGRKVAVHWTAILAALPAFAGGVVMTRIDSMPLGIAAVAAGVLAMALLHTYLVPVVKAG
jgi:hypothetical protein